MNYTGIMDDEIFVGNVNTNRDLSHLKGIKYRLGTQALGIDGKPISPNYMLPLFVKKDDFNAYNNIMMASMKNN
jgi:hypothetical protein